MSKVKEATNVYSIYGGSNSWENFAKIVYAMNLVGLTMVQYGFEKPDFYVDVISLLSKQELCKKLEEIDTLMYTRFDVKTLLHVA